MDKVLVLDCWMRKGLSVVRALGREGLEVHCSGHKSINPARFSKYTKKFFIFPNPETDPKNFKKKLIETIKKENYSCVFPLEEPTIELILGFREEIEKYTKLPLVGKETFEKAVDKWNSVRLAQKLGIPAPESYCPRNSEEVKKAIKKIGFPLIIKPRKTSGGRGLKKITSQKEFDEFYEGIVSKYGRPMLQEYIGEGPGVLGWFIIDNKKVVAEFTYKRLRKYPLNSGPGTMWESTDDKRIKEYSEKLSKALDWYGIIIVEFKVDPKDNKPKFMEINPRLGGSTAHPLFCGVNFPYIMYLQVMNKKIVKPKYIVGRKTRWLVADAMHFITNKDRWKMKPSFFNFKNTYYEEFDSTDFRGNIWIIANYILNFFDIEIWMKGVIRK